MSKLLSVTLLAGASAIAALAPTQAEATPVAVWSGSVQIATGESGGPSLAAGVNTVGSQAVSSADGSASVLSTATPLPAMTATATANPTALGSRAFYDLSYGFEISGPVSNDATASVNVFATGSLFSGPGSTQSSAFLSINGATIVNASSFGGNNNGAFTTSTALSGLFYNADYFIDMNVLSLVHPSGAASGTATTFLDPYLFLDPSLVAQGYSIVTSDGIGNSLTVNAVPGPEVGSGFSAFILSAISLLGWWRRKRRGSMAIADMPQR